MLFSLYISLLFFFSCIDRQLSFFIPSLLLSTLSAGVPGNEEANSLANRIRECRGSRARELTYTTEANSARRISERKSAAKSVGGREMQQTLPI